MLGALERGLRRMSEVTREEGVPYEGENWHMETVYEEVRRRVGEEGKGEGGAVPRGECMDRVEYNGVWGGGGDVGGSLGRAIAKIICGRKMSCRTDYTPRADPGRNLRGIVVDVPEGKEGNLRVGGEEYEGWDVGIEGQRVPEGEVDVMKVVMGGGGEAEGEGEGAGEGDNSQQQQQQPPPTTPPPTQPPPATPPKNVIDPTYWRLEKAMAGTCDGTTQTSCGRNVGSTCLLYGHNDGRGAIVGNSNTGPITFEIPPAGGGATQLVMLRYESEGGKSGFEDGRTRIRARVSVNGEEKVDEVFKAVDGDDNVVVVYFEEGREGGGEEDTAAARVTISVEEGATSEVVLTHLYWA